LRASCFTKSSLSQANTISHGLKNNNDYSSFGEKFGSQNSSWTDESVVLGGGGCWGSPRILFETSNCGEMNRDPENARRRINLSVDDCISSFFSFSAMLKFLNLYRLSSVHKTSQIVTVETNDAYYVLV